MTLQDVNPGSLDQPVKEGAHQDARTISADMTEAAAVGLIGFQDAKVGNSFRFTCENATELREYVLPWLLFSGIENVCFTERLGTGTLWLLVYYSNMRNVLAYTIELKSAAPWSLLDCFSGPCLVTATALSCTIHYRRSSTSSASSLSTTAVTPPPLPSHSTGWIMQDAQPTTY